MYVDDLKLAGKKQNINPMWRIIMKDVDLGEPTSCFDHFYLGCTQRECQKRKDFVDKSMFESKISAGATEILPEEKRATEKPGADTISSWSYDMESHAKKCVERYCELANKKQLSNSIQSRRHAWMIINSKKKKWDQLENCPQFAHKLF